VRQTLGDFLLRRLEEVGVRHIFGVPGDYNLELLQQLEDRRRPQWIGNCNELNASYAADGYARLNGLGALIVTDGVGALSAMNGIAGSYCEHVPVICICGSIPQASIDRGWLMHHTMADGSQDRFYRAFAEVTIAQAKLTPENAVVEIDRLILTAWRQKLPVYMELPSDLGYTEVDAPEAPLILAYPLSDEERLTRCCEKIVARLQNASSPALLLDIDADRFGVAEQVAALADQLQLPVATLPGSKGTFCEQSPLFAGVYSGAWSTPALRRLIESSDCLLSIGFRRVDSTSGIFTDDIPENAIHLKGRSVCMEDENFQAVFLGELLSRLIRETRPQPRRSSARVESTEAGTSALSQRLLSQKEYWQAMQCFIQPGDLLVADNGTSGAGVAGLRLPCRSTLITQSVWGSIGYSLGCLLGTLMAAPERRQILFIGDGSFQLTAQELSTIVRHELKPYIFLINNGGYTIERTILGRSAKYNDVANWRYTEMAKSLSRTQEIETFIVHNSQELDAVLSSNHRGMVFVELVMDPMDAPVRLIHSMRAIANLDYGPSGPQSVSGAQITEDDVR
jgi:indolepyruvate decarboxylase